MAIEIKRFKTKDGQEGSYAPIGGRNIEDAEAVKAFAVSRGFELKHREMNQVEFLRTEEPGIAELGMCLITDLYRYKPTTRINADRRL